MLLKRKNQVKIDPEPIYKGAEANLYHENNKLIKHRVRKKYRIPELDKKLRRRRTKREAKLLDDARRAGIKVPKVYETRRDECKILMEFIDGEPLRDIIIESGEKETGKIAGKIGKIIAVLHESDLIHNDLTTSNMLLYKDEIYMIDFGLGVMSKRLEDKAMDMVVLKKSLRAMYPVKFEVIWEGICAGYRNYDNYLEIFKRIETIEKRARYL